MPNSLSRLLTQPRQCSSDWLVIRAKQLADAGRRYSAHNLLIYGALEARNAIEQIWFEILSLVHEGEMTVDYFLKCRKTSDGFLAAIQRAEPRYRKIFTFTKLALEIDTTAQFRGIVWDLRILKRQWHDLSDYCHTQGAASPTLDSKEWVDKGYRLIDETHEYFRKQMTGGATALLKPSAMTPSARAVWERYEQGELSEVAVSEALRNNKADLH